jgi:hypothetical protein
MLKYLFLIAALSVPATASADHRDNPKWIEYQSRKAARKAEARAKLAEIRAAKDNSRVPLSYRLDVNVAMPHGHLYRNPSAIWWPCRRPSVIIIR